LSVLAEIDASADKSDADVPNAIAGVSAPSFREIFDTHHDYLWCSLRRMGVHPGDLDDVCHEVLLSVHHNLPKYDPTRPLRPWLFAFAFHAASDFRRLARHRVSVGLDEVEPIDGSLDPEQALFRREAGRLVDEALQAISPTNRGVFIMYEIDGTDMKDIASALNVPLHTAYSRLRLARATFEAKVRELRGETP